MTFASAVREYECTEEKLTRLGLVARQPGWACKLAGVLTSVVFMVPGLMFLANLFIGRGLLLDDDQTRRSACSHFSQGGIRHVLDCCLWPRLPT